MELFNKFRETIFLKENSSLEKQIEELKSIRDNVSNKEQIDRDIKLLEIGLQGEKSIAFELKNANIGIYVLQDITLQFEDLKAQIDYVIITKGYTYLVECKNLIGNITVDNKGEFKREYEIYGRKYKESIYSPYTQAVRHKEILKKIWLSNHSKLTTMIKEKAFDSLWYKPLVVLANSKSLLNIRYASSDIKKNIIRLDQLTDVIKRDIEKYDRDIYSSKNRMLEQANNFLKLNVEEYNSFASKYENNTDNASLLEQKLKDFRIERAGLMKIPKHYVFTDDEMNKLISKKPITMEDLKNSKILPEIKIKCHGEEIVKMFL